MVFWSTPHPWSRVAALAAALLALSGCNVSSKDDDSASTGATNTPPATLDPTTDNRVTGSIGDGPIVGARLRVYSESGELLVDNINSGADYDITIRTRGRNYPLDVVADQGTDLVTGLAPDFQLLSVISSPANRTINNLNPFSTLIYKTAASLGSVEDYTVNTARNTMLTRYSFGLDSRVLPDPVTTPISDSNIHHIVKASETLGEMIRRTRDAMIATGAVIDGDAIVNMLAADLTDGWIDGAAVNGGAHPRIAAVANIASAAVVLEAMTNQLQVNGLAAETAMDMAIQQVRPGVPSTSVTGNVPVSNVVLQQLIRALWAAHVVQPDDRIVTTIAALETVADGTPAEQVATLLPAGLPAVLRQATENSAYASAFTLETINAQATGTTAPPIPAPEPVPEPEPEPTPQPEPEPVPVPQPNNPPTIGGSPSTALLAGEAWSFTPSAQDADGDNLNFWVLGAPAWTDFDSATGRLSGRPDISQAGSYPNIRISVSDGESSAQLAAFTLTVTAPEPPNNPPTLSGSPDTSVLAGESWSFTPSAQDADGDTLNFTVLGAPGWMTFDTTTGQLSGTPNATQVGSYPNIRISVSDGEAVTQLTAFTITVTAPQPVTGTATLTWLPPTEHLDGSPLATISAYRIYFGRDPANLEQVITVSGGLTTYLIENLEQGTWYFAIAAVDGSGAEGGRTGNVSKTIP